MKKILLVLIIFLGQMFAFGQESSEKILPKRNTIYLDVFGQAMYFSLSYDRLFRANKKVKTSIATGLTLFPIKYNLAFGSQSSFNFLFGQKNHKFEMGLGLTYLYEKIYTEIGFSDFPNYPYSVTRTNYFYFSPKIGYRYQKIDGGLFFKFDFTPISTGISVLNSKTTFYYDVPKHNAYSNNFNRWVGLSIGYTLK